MEARQRPFLVPREQVGQQAGRRFLGRGDDPLPAHRGVAPAVGEPVGQRQQPQRIFGRSRLAQQDPGAEGEQHQAGGGIVQVRALLTE
jgi:hypothetical protein